MTQLSVEITKESEENLRKLRRALDPDELFRKIEVFLDRQAALASAYVIKNSLSGQILNVRTGNLRRRVTGTVVRVNGLPAIRVGVFRGAPQAGILERGGTIRPKRAKALAIPTDEAKTSSGVPRYDGPRDYPGELRFIPFRQSGVAIGGLFDAADVEAADGDFESIRALFILLRQVKIPAYRWLSTPMREYIPILARELAEFLREEVRRAAT